MYKSFANTKASKHHDLSTMLTSFCGFKKDSKLLNGYILAKATA